MPAVAWETPTPDTPHPTSHPRDVGAAPPTVVTADHPEPRW